MRNLGIIIKREYFNKVRNKSFIIMTFVTPLIIVGFSALIGYLTSVNNTSNVKNISILDQTGLFYDSFENSETINYEFMDKISLNEAKTMVITQNKYGLLYIPSENEANWYDRIQFFSEESPNIQLMTQISRNIEKLLFQKNLTDKGIQKQDIDEAKVKISVALENFSGQKSSEFDNLLRIAIGGSCGLFIIYVHYYLRKYDYA